MSHELKVYRTLPDREALALRIVADDNGVVSLLPGDEFADDAKRMLAGGVVMPGTPLRVIMPAHGLEYLSAVHRMLLRSSAWRTGTD